MLLWGLVPLLAGCGKPENPFSGVNEALKASSKVIVITPARPGLFLSSKAEIPAGKEVKVVEKAGEQEFVVVYGNNGKPVSVLIPLTSERIQVVTDAPTLADYDSKISKLTAPPTPAPTASSGGSGDSSGGLGSQPKGKGAWGLTLGMTQAEVKKLKGSPDSINGDVWFYEPLSPGHDLAREGSSSAIAYLPFGGLLAQSASEKAAPKKKKYLVYFTNGVVSNVIVQSF
ncbi:hypothetical protein SAMN05444156_2463 [Verrucomicrobium sp. GAS474]|nr:hypothetical protein SAMN05444156_2463 [Verrucomicrobium sp. GAS474]